MARVYGESVKRVASEDPVTGELQHDGSRVSCSKGGDVSKPHREWLRGVEQNKQRTSRRNREFRLANGKDNASNQPRNYQPKSSR